MLTPAPAFLRVQFTFIAAQRNRADGWLSGDEHWLLMQKIQVQSTAPTWCSQLSITTVPGGLLSSSGICGQQAHMWYIGIHAGETLIQIF